MFTHDPDKIGTHILSEGLADVDDDVPVRQDDGSARLARSITR